MDAEGDLRFASTDRVLAEWRQGDCALGEHWFVYRCSPSSPVTDAGRSVAEAGGELVEVPEKGLVVLTQTCDIIRSCEQRPFIEVCPLILVSSEYAREIDRGARPAFATVPLLRGQQLVADLDRVMTIEKSVLTGWTRVPGCATDADTRNFARALARKRARFAFPDDFTEFVRRLLVRLREKHDRQSPEGRALRALREIRVSASPSWDASPCALFFWFVRAAEETDFEGEGWAGLVDAWLELVPELGRFTEVHGQVAALEDLRAADYVDSDPLDLDYLSTRGEL